MVLFMKKAIVAWFLAILMVLTQISTVMADTTGSWIETADISDAIVSGGVAECIEYKQCYYCKLWTV